MAGTPTAVVFDLDGTLVDTMTSVPTAYADTIRALGGPTITPADVVRTWHIGATPTVLQHFLGRPVAADDLECYYRHLESVIEVVRPFPGVPELVDGLSRAGYRLGILTSATRRSTTLILEASGLSGLFRTVVCGDETTKPKPAPDGLWLVCHLLEVAATETVYVGDAEVDLACADSAGAAAIHACWSESATAAAGFPAVANHPADVAELVRCSIGRAR